MRILFIENRFKTPLWEAVAERLRAAGHEVVWLVQNPGFRPRIGRVTVLPFPTRGAAEPLPEEARRIASSDRNLNYFGGTDGHYAHYRRAIAESVVQLAPDVAFGESTLFHELLTGLACRERGIPFLNPSTCRIPTGRFSFYQDDTLVPFGGSDATFEEATRAEWLEALAKRRVRPDYMAKAPPGQRYLKARAAAWTLASYVRGERFNTPAPTRKWHLERELERQKARWEAQAAGRPWDAAKPGVLYALQMQPEANLDVWGNAYRDQPALLRAILAATPDDQPIWIKPNPKSKYEMSCALNDLVAGNPRLIPLPHATPMDEVFWPAPLIVTVSGTVALEAIFTDKPVVTLIETLNNQCTGCVHVANPHEIGGMLAAARAGTFPVTPAAEKRAFFDALTRTSYPGLISDPIHAPSCVDADNVDRLAAAFEDVLGRLGRRKGPVASGHHQLAREASTDE